MLNGLLDVSDLRLHKTSGTCVPISQYIDAFCPLSFLIQSLTNWCILLSGCDVVVNARGAVRGDDLGLVEHTWSQWTRRHRRARVQSRHASPEAADGRVGSAGATQRLNVSLFRTKLAMSTRHL